MCKRSPSLLLRFYMALILEFWRFRVSSVEGLGQFHFLQRHRLQDLLFVTLRDFGSVQAQISDCSGLEVSTICMSVQFHTFETSVFTVYMLLGIHILWAIWKLRTYCMHLCFVFGMSRFCEISNFWKVNIQRFYIFSISHFCEIALLQNVRNHNFFICGISHFCTFRHSRHLWVRIFHIP